MAAGRYDIDDIEQGFDWELEMTWEDDDGLPINLTGYTANMMAKTSYDSAPFIDLSTENGGIILGGENGTIKLVMTSLQTGALTVYKGVYDLKLIEPAGNDANIRLLFGQVTINKGITA